MRCDAWAGILLWWSCQSPVAHSCSLLKHPDSFCWRMFKLSVKFDADSLLYSLSHFECDGHTVHTLIQWCLPPPLTSTVKSSLFTHVHCSPLSLAARLHWCCANCSCYINSGWTFSGQTSYIETLQWVTCSETTFRHIPSNIRNHMRLLFIILTVQHNTEGPDKHTRQKLPPITQV